VALSFRDQLSRGGGLSSASTKRRVDASINSGLFMKQGLAGTAVKSRGGFGWFWWLVEKLMQFPSYSSDIFHILAVPRLARTMMKLVLPDPSPFT
jgi:hypothetical protein